jgi:hypothetical protein
MVSMTGTRSGPMPVGAIEGERVSKDLRSWLLLLLLLLLQELVIIEKKVSSVRESLSQWLPWASHTHSPSRLQNGWVKGTTPTSWLQSSPV